MIDYEELERRLSETRIAPRHDPAHKEALRRELRTRINNRRPASPFILAAIAAVTLGSTFVNQPSLESTGLDLDVAEVVDDGLVFLSTRPDAKTGFGVSRHTDDGGRAAYTRPEADDLRDQMERLQRGYLEGRLPLAHVAGLTFGGMTEYYLDYGEAGSALTFPVTVGCIEESARLQRFISSPRYREICRAAHLGTLGPAATDTLMLNGTAVAISSWRFTDPECGAIVYHRGLPLN